MGPGRRAAGFPKALKKIVDEKPASCEQPAQTGFASHLTAPAGGWYPE